MKEIKEIIFAYDKLVKEEKRSALATVVHVEGSSYRRPGARMLISEDGELTGAISGGCLEGDALRKALQVIVENRARLVTYDTNDEDDAKLGMGLGCNGIIQVLIEPINASTMVSPIELLKKAIEKREASVLTTLFNLNDRKTQQYGTCLMAKADLILENPNIPFRDALVKDARNALQNLSTHFKSYSDDKSSITAFIEYISVPVSIVIAGAGNDVLPLVQMSQVLGWEVTVVDGRNNMAKSDRFPMGCQVLLAKPEEVLRNIKVDKQTVFVLMTHNYNYDLAFLKELVEHDAVYIGLLGPRKKRDRIIEELQQNGMKMTAIQLESIHGPVGLDIGAETPEEIALSILAEIKGFMAGGEGKQLKDKTGPIHKRADTAIENVKLKPE